MSHNEPERYSRAAKLGVYIAVFVVVAACAIIVSLNFKVRDKISAFASAKTDSLQWSLAQFDVELLAFQNAVAGALHTSNPSLVEVRRRYDIFYSRVETIRSSALYKTLIESGSSADQLSRVDGFLSAATHLIDASDQQLVEALPDLAARVEELRPVVRNITLSGITHFSGNADLQREGVVSLLSLVSTITSAIIVVLLLLLVLLLRVNRQAHKKTDEQSQMRSRLQAVVSTSLDAVIVADLEGRILDFNEAAEEIFGYPRAEAIGALMEELIVPEHLVDAHRAGMDRYRKTGKPKVIGKGRVQLEGRRRSGEVFPVELSISSARSAEGEIFVSFLRDISPRVAAEKELIKARDDAVAGERAKANFLAVMSHEMRTPLNGLLGTLELLDMETVTERQRNWLDIIRSSGQQLLIHVNNVLDISRADAGKIEVVSEEFSVTKLVSELVESQRALAEHRGNLISYAVSTNGHDRCIGDINHLRQVLLNLIGNAVKFTRDGKITITADRVEHDAMVEFRITDTGIGINDDDQARIFED
ncbi:MAG: sensor histidine kinase, partial [Rhizobiaceae bacterium]